MRADGIAVKKGNTALLDKINEVLDPIVEDGTFEGVLCGEQVEASSMANEAEDSSEAESGSRDRNCF